MKKFNIDLDDFLTIEKRSTTVKNSRGKATQLLREFFVVDTVGIKNELKRQTKTIASEIATQEEARRKVLEAERKKTLTSIQGQLKSSDGKIDLSGFDLDVDQAKIVKSLFGEYNKSVQALDALNKAKELGLITDQQYVNNAVKVNTELQKTRLLLGEGGFDDALTSGLGKVVENYTNVLSELSDSFGSFFQSVTDGFANSIGRAIVMGEDLEKSLKSVAQNALAQIISSLIKIGIQYGINASLGQAATATTTATNVAAGAATAAAWGPAAAAVSLASFGANAAPAAAALTSAYGLQQSLSVANNAVGLAGFKDGGYTGNIGTSEVAGVVHGREFVMNADATARNRPMLEAMNRGGSASSSVGMTQMNVTVENYGNSEISVEQVSATDVRIIARDVAKQTVAQEAPGVIAADLSNPNSRVSKSLNQNTTATRKR